jgi:UrcA family protein
MRNGTAVTTLLPVCLTLAAATLLLGPGTAAAAAAEAPSVTIRFADLNLSTSAGAQTLYHRISGAARMVCGPEGRNLDEQREARGCYEQAVRRAVAQVHNPLLSAELADLSPEIRTAMLTE